MLILEYVNLRWPSASRARAAVAALPAITDQLTASETFPGASETYVTTSGIQVLVEGVNDSPVSRAHALSVPAVLRGVTLLATKFAGLDIERTDANGNPTALGWLEQPEPGRSRFHTFNDLAMDVILDGRAFLRINNRAGREPARGGCEYIALHRITDMRGRDGKPTILIDGQDVDPANIIGIPGWHDGIRRVGARTIRTALALEAAAKRYADSPLPAVILKESAGDYDPPTDDELEAELTKFKRARNSEGVAMLRGYEPVTSAWSSAELQLVEARQYLSTQIANLLGIPARKIAGATPQAGGTIQYQNISTNNRELVEDGLDPLIQTFQGRLSMSDALGSAWSAQVTPRGNKVRFLVDGLTRDDALTRVQVWKYLIDMDVLTPEQVAALEPLVPTPTTGVAA